MEGEGRILAGIVLARKHAMSENRPMSLTIKCPACGHSARGPKNAHGSRVTCPKCRHDFVLFRPPAGESSIKQQQTSPETQPLTPIIPHKPEVDNTKQLCSEPTRPDIPTISDDPLPKIAALGISLAVFLVFGVIWWFNSHSERTQIADCIVFFPFSQYLPSSLVLA